MGTERATGDPLESKRLYFCGVFRFSNKLDISRTKRANVDPLVLKQLDFQGLFRMSKKLKFWISGFLDFCIYFGFLEQRSFWRSAGVKTIRFLRAFQISAWVTQPEHPNVAKDEVERARRAQSQHERLPPRIII